MCVGGGGRRDPFAVLGEEEKSHYTKSVLQVYLTEEKALPPTKAFIITWSAFLVFHFLL